MKRHIKFEKWALPILKKYQKLLLLNHFSTPALENRLEFPDSAAECKFCYPYQRIIIGYGPHLIKLWEDKDYLQAKRILLHEMCHPITDPLYAKATNRHVSKDEILDEREKLTDHITNIIINNNIL